MSYRRASPIKPALALLAALLALCAAAAAQVPPEATTPRGLPISGTLSCNLRYSQSTDFGGPLGGQQFGYASGDATYANTSQRLPFSMQYGGGYGKAWAGPPTAGNVNQHLMLTQGWIRKAWSLNASENVNYTFETPTTGFSGVPGSGEPIGGSGSTTAPDQTVLALNTRVLDNMTTVGFGERIDRATTLNVTGTTGQIHFIDNDGLNTDMRMAAAGVTRRLDAHDSVSSQYSISHFSYSSSGFTSLTNTLQFSFTRQWNRHLTTTASAGPLWISSAGVASTGGLAAPNSTMLSLNASAAYQMRHGSANVSYFHGTSGGSGYMLGAKTDSVNGGYNRDFGRSLTVGVTGDYMRSSSLIAAEYVQSCTGGSTGCLCPTGETECIVQVASTPVTNAIFGGVQATQKLGRYFNVFANYTAIDQSSNLQTLISSQTQQVNYNASILNGLSRMIAFGIAYSPRAIHLRK